MMPSPVLAVASGRSKMPGSHSPRTRASSAMALVPLVTVPIGSVTATEPRGCSSWSWMMSLQSGKLTQSLDWGLGDAAVSGIPLTGAPSGVGDAKNPRNLWGGRATHDVQPSQRLKMKPR